MELRMPPWLDDELRGRGWPCAVAAGLVVAAAVAWWWMAAAPARHEGIVVLPARDASRGASTATVATRSAAATSSLLPVAACPHDRLDLSWLDRGGQRSCVGTARVVQDGALRRYMLEPEGTSDWRLRIDTAGGEVVAARLSSPRGDYVCADSSCQRFDIGPPDRHGVRRIVADETALHPATDADAKGTPAVWLTASLAVRTDTDSVAACAVPRLTIVDDQGGLGVLCPDAGAGVELTGDGRRRYVFNDNDGRELVVTLAATGLVEQVQLQGLRCEGTACGGAVSMPEGETSDTLAAGRTFAFHGTQLSMPSALAAGERRTATLTGSLVLPAQ